MLTVFTLIPHKELHQKAQPLVTEHAYKMHVKPAAFQMVHIKVQNTASTQLHRLGTKLFFSWPSNAVTKQQYTHYEQWPNPFFQMYLDYSLMKIPQNYNLPNYRFPTQGKSYISVPGEALTMQCEYAHLTNTRTKPKICWWSLSWSCSFREQCLSMQWSATD